MSVFKLLSENNTQYEDSIIEGIRKVLSLTSKQKIPTKNIAHLKMGTTLTTNALLKRKGERLALLTTKGFKDALKIGYQNRPHLFELNIQLPSMLYEKAIEINERSNAQGQVLKAICEAEVYQQLKKLFAEGFKTIAIVLMNSYKLNKHEKLIGSNS